jgi:hypothetical protein
MLAPPSFDQPATEARWLRLTREIVTAGKATCVCWLSSATARWSGYLGAGFADPHFPNRRVLFVGANHNSGPKGLPKTPLMAEYNSRLLAWAKRQDASLKDDELLKAMRFTYEDSWRHWGAVWRTFGELRTEIGIRGQYLKRDNAFAFINLARCPHPVASEDDICIEACQRAFPLRNLVEAIDARVIFIAKNSEGAKEVVIPGIEDGSRLVYRYSNWGTAQMDGAPKKEWIARYTSIIRAFIEAKPLMTNGT